MADRLFLSCWVRGYDAGNMLRHYAKLVRLFPHSRLATGSTELRVYAFEEREPPLVERAFAPPIDPEVLVEAAREFVKADCSAEIEAWWDLWQFDGEWRLAPARATLIGYGPAFDRDLGEHLRVEFGIEDRFLPQPEVAGSARLAQSNLRSLLHLVNQLDDALALDDRRLWSESGENFAERLARVTQEAR